MSRRAWRRRLVPGFALLLATILLAQDQPKEKLDRMYQSAVADYEGGRFRQAASGLESLVPYAPKSYEIHELLGLSYASLSENDKAIEHLKIAVQVKPDSAAGRTNLGTILFHSGQASLAAEQFRQALKLEPQSYDANHNLGEFYIHSGNVTEAAPLLEHARQIDPTSYDNSYDLAMTDFLLGRLDAARQIVTELAKTRDSSELHNLLGQIQEKDGKFVDAANQFEAAAHMDPSEQNLFDWGGEMMLHRTYEAAIAVYQEGVRRYPDSPRLQIGLGLSLYSRGKYDDAVAALLKAADLNPSDPRCYLFLSKAYNSSPLQADGVLDRFRRYADLKPNDALAQYYYAISLWKGKRTADSSVDAHAVESLLLKSIALDDKLADAYVQLGNLYAEQHEYERAIPQYERALQLDENLSDAHYRLGTNLVHVGQKDRAQKEFAIYQKLRAEHLAEADKERAEVQQFVYETRAAETAKP